MPVGREEQQHQQQVQQGGRHRGGGLAAGVVGPAHAHAHLHVDGLAAQQRDVEKQVHHQPQHVPQKQLQPQQDQRLQDRARRLRQVVRHGVGRDAQKQDEAALHHTRDALPAEDGVEEDNAAHPGQNQQKQGQRPPVHGRAP